MKASEVVKKLRQCRKDNGDVTVFVYINGVRRPLKEVVFEKSYEDKKKGVFLS